MVNAVVHADYSQTGSPIRVAIFEDRIEIENPGLLPFGLTVDEVSRHEGENQCKRSDEREIAADR